MASNTTQPLLLRTSLVIAEHSFVVLIYIPSLFIAGLGVRGTASACQGKGWKEKPLLSLRFGHFCFFCLLAGETVQLFSFVLFPLRQLGCVPPCVEY